MQDNSINPEVLSARFQSFAAECQDNSPLYYQLSNQIATDTDLLQLCTYAREGQPVPNLFLAAVHYLILTNRDASLAQYYPSTTGHKVQTIPFIQFKAFVHNHEEAIKNIFKHRIVQTNVLTRCNYLLPIFSNIISQSNNAATIIDIGCSAGLNLNYDQYEYYYNNKKVYGESPVKLHCQIKGSKQPVINKFNRTIMKIGIDQHLFDLTDAGDRTWLQALIWPDQLERVAMFNQALHIASHSDLQLYKGNTTADFWNVINDVDPSHTLIISATHVLYQFTQQALYEFYIFLDELGQKRDFYFVSAESTKNIQSKYNIKNTAVVLTWFKNKQKNETLIAETNDHGNWLIWRNFYS